MENKSLNIFNSRLVLASPQARGRAAARSAQTLAL
jgi:hypothetical protein